LLQRKFRRVFNIDALSNAAKRNMVIVKFNKHGTVENVCKGRSGRPRTVRAYTFSKQGFIDLTFSKTAMEKPFRLILSNTSTFW